MAQRTAEEVGLCGYVCFYGNQRVELYAKTYYEAMLKVGQLLKVPKKKQHLISATLCEREDGSEVVHTAVD